MDIEVKMIIVKFFWNISNNAGSEIVICKHKHQYKQYCVHLMRQICNTKNIHFMNDFGMCLNNIFKEIKMITKDNFMMFVQNSRFHTIDSVTLVCICIIVNLGLRIRYAKVFLEEWLLHKRFVHNILCTLKNLQGSAY